MKPYDWPDGNAADCSVIPVVSDDGASLANDALMALGNAGRARDFDLIAAEQLADQCPRAKALLNQIAEDMEKHRIADGALRYQLDDYSDDDKTVIAQILGEGEVGVIVSGSLNAQIQESVLAGVWRVYVTDADGTLVSDYIEVGDVPEVVRFASHQEVQNDFDIGEAPEGAMNVMPVLAEIHERMAAHRPGQPNHVISFTLLPMTPEDMSFLQKTLGMGNLQIISRGYGTCRIVGTGVQNVWSVQYFNAMDTVILDTLEIGDLPVSVIAGQEDIEDSAERLRDIMEAYL